MAITWQELKEKIEEEMDRRGIPHDVQIAYIDLTGYETDSLHVHAEPETGLAIWT